MAVDPNQHDRFVLRQKFAMVINRYVFALADEEPETPFCFVEQARYKFKEDIRFYTDESKAVELLRIKARQRFDPRATYDVTGADGSKLGEIQKVFGKSLFRSTYAINTPTGDVVAQEQNPVIALFRRLVGFIPYVGDFADFLPIPYHFEFRRDGELIGAPQAPDRPVARRLRHRLLRGPGAPTRPPPRARDRGGDGRAAGAMTPRCAAPPSWPRSTSPVSRRGVSAPRPPTRTPSRRSTSRCPSAARIPSR